MAVEEVLSSLLLGGVMGVIGQGARAAVGLKKLHDENASKPPNESDAFMASRLTVSLFLGFVAGVIAALSLGLDKLAGLGAGDISLLLGIAAAGYAGTDVIEAFVARTPGMGAASETPGSAGPAAPAKQESTDDSGVSGGVARLEARVAGIGTEIASIRSVIDANKAMAVDIGLARTETEEVEPVALQDGAPDLIAPELVQQIFVPATPLANIRKHLPSVLEGLRAKHIFDRPMLLMALATIRAETEGFVPISEFVSKFNTQKTPFDKYDKGTPKGRELGNTQAGDGPRFRGRGFVQLTGRDNYKRVGSQMGVALVDRPELANDSTIAGLILAQFLLNKQDAIRAALAENDLAQARRLVNGGSHGLDRFRDAYAKGDELIPDFATG
jgi:hypothetical protein